MARVFDRPRRTARGIGLVVALAPLLATGAETAVQQTQRLGSWLDERATRQEPVEPLGLMWMVESELEPQRRWRDELLAALESLRQTSSVTTRPSIEGLIDRIRQEPATGRVLLPGPADARWLEVHPEADPLLRPGDRLRWQARATTVRVRGLGRADCVLAHRPDAPVADYVSRCAETRSRAAVDWAWVVQPDGRTQRVGLAAWNPTPPLALAPGATVWLSSEGSADSSAVRKLRKQVDDAMVRWLAWQGPAIDEAPWPHPDAGARFAESDPVVRSPVSATAGPANTGVGDWGFGGLLQTPTARSGPAGSFVFSLQYTAPYTRSSVLLQPFDELEFGFRYINIADRAYGPQALSGGQDYKDKSLDVKWRFVDESRLVPALAVGVLDLGGTGLFGSEYLVASKRWWNWDFSLGLAWGYLGGRGDLERPLAPFLGRRFDVRPTPQQLTGQGGVPALSRLFRGPAALIGGLQVRPGQGPWLLKLELDGNNYRQEPSALPLTQRTPVNLGLVYSVTQGVELSLGLERGNRAAVGLTLRPDLAALSVPKLLDPPLPPPAAARTMGDTDWAGMAAVIESRSDWAPEALARQGGRLRVDVAEPGGRYQRERIDRVLESLDRLAPEDIREFELRASVLGAPVLSAQASREEWGRSRSEPPRSASPVDPVRIERLKPDAPAAPAKDESWLFRPSAPWVTVEPAMNFEHTLGGPDGFILYQINAALRGELALPARWRAAGEWRLRLLDNYDRFRYDGPSLLPRVRTQMREYLTTRRSTLHHAYLGRAAHVAGNHYAAVYGGYLEPMFGGVGGEWLYRRNGSPWALGVDVNRVRQRDVRQDLAWQPYQVTTGHVSAYWDTGWNGVSTQLSVGQYLAGDRGATLLLRRSFTNGVSMYAFATKTNVSAAQFGEGSFDKGIGLEIPFDALLPRSSPLIGSFGWKPLTRDGGAMLARPMGLFGETYMLAPDAMSYRSAPLPDTMRRPDQQQRANEQP